MPQIKEMVLWASGNRENLCRLWDFVCSDNMMTSKNALWIMTHLPDSDSEWLLSLRDNMIDKILKENDTGKKRMLLQILRKHEYEADGLRTDFLDFCMSKINSECEPYAIRCFSMYAALKMCRHYPELIEELDGHLDMMQYQHLSPGLKSALRQIKAKIRKLKS